MREATIEAEGVIAAKERGGFFRVRLDRYGGHVILTRLCNRMDQKHIRQMNIPDAIHRLRNRAIAAEQAQQFGLAQDLRLAIVVLEQIERERILVGRVLRAREGK